MAAPLSIPVRAVAGCLAGLALVGTPGQADETLSPGPPQVDGVFPVGVGWSVRTNLTLSGTLGALPLRGWCDDPGVTLERSATNSVFQVTVTTNATPGVHWLRFWNDDGVSDWRPFVVSDVAEWTLRTNIPADTVPADIELPVAINARWTDGLVTNAMTVAVATNRILEVKVQALGLDSPVSGSLAVADGFGTVLDSAGTEAGVDPRLSVRFPAGGLARVQFAAAPGDLETNGVVAGAAFRIVLREEPLRPAAQPSGALVLSPDPEMQRPDLSPRIKIPGFVTGFITTPLEEDWYSFDAVQGQTYWFQLRAASIDSPLRAVLRVADRDHQSLVQSAPAGDPELGWTAPDNGRYAVAVIPEPGSGSPDSIYQLELGQPRAQLKATLSAHTLIVAPGESVALDIDVVKPPTFDRMLVITAQGVPPGVVAAPAHLPPELSRATLTFTAAADAAPGSAPCQVILMTVDTPIQVEIAKAEVAGRYAPPGKLLRNDTEHFWVTVRAGR